MRWVSTISLILLLGTSATAQRITLNGRLKTDSGISVPHTRISVAGGPSRTTDSKGQFSLPLSNDFREGERVIIIVHKPNWVINYPLDGEWNLPNTKLQSIQALDVIIVPRGSKALWTHARIEKEISKLSDQLAQAKRPMEFSAYLNQLANKLGLTQN